MAEIVFLGTSGYQPTIERDNAAFLLKAGEASVLVDCPGSLIRKVLTAGTDPLDIDAIFITHVHTDHVYGLPSLIHGLMLRDHVFRVYGSAETVDFCRNLLDVFGLRDPKYRTRAEFTVIGPGGEAEAAGEIRAMALAVPHHASSLAYAFESAGDGKRIVFSGDTPLHPGLFKAAGGADALVHDCGAPARFFERYPVLKSVHTSALDLGAWSERAAVRLLAPVHFLTELPFEAGEIEKEIRARFTGRLVIPSDMDRLAVP